MEQHPYWLSQALSAEQGGPAPALVSDKRAQPCIHGGDFTGLWTAILAKRARPEPDVLVLEADVCGGGGGASVRNGGCALT
ncbi:MAG: hypothetical protein Q8R06_02645 [Polaromonas sp.]|uniref:hypothetical protein n=1 Tax=Polaromonas sp. TaxID=1869339 RepID=UPI0027351171|nr:hypothetical protein [Polaromonas sp.]MDP3796034.1 hypothetical protein [Polaromonas sp.]